jgi:hypothetical protein
VQYVYCKSCNAPITKDLFVNHCRLVHKDNSKAEDLSANLFSSSGIVDKVAVEPSSAPPARDERVPLEIFAMRKSSFTVLDRKDSVSSQKTSQRVQTQAKAVDKESKRDRKDHVKPMTVVKSSIRGGGGGKEDRQQQPPAETSGQQQVVGRASLQTEWDALLLDRTRENDTFLVRPVSDWLARVLRVSARYNFGTDDAPMNEEERGGGGTSSGRADAAGESIAMAKIRKLAYIFNNIVLCH